MTDKSKVPPDLFSRTMRQIRGGMTDAELSEDIADCLKASIRTGKMSTMTVTLKIRPYGDNQFEFVHEVKTKLPKDSVAPYIMWGTQNYDLLPHHPAQGQLLDHDGNAKGELKQVEKAPIKD